MHKAQNIFIRHDLNNPVVLIWETNELIVQIHWYWHESLAAE